MFSSKETAMTDRLEQLTEGQAIPFSGDRVAYVGRELAEAFTAGDRLLVIQETGDLLRVPAAAQAAASSAVGKAYEAFQRMGQVSDSQISRFFEAFAARLEDDVVWAEIAAVNAADVESAQARGRSTTRLKVSDGMRRDMAAGLRQWRDAESVRGKLVERVDWPGFSVEQLMAPLGVVGFIFEGRPNVFADAAGVIRGGNTVVFRIGSDALGTARAISRAALDPALAEAGLPAGAAALLESAEHAAGWAMFMDRRLSLAVARGSGPTVDQLGAIARQAGTPVSLHGTGGAWMLADRTADAARFAAAVENSVDRKVCNSLNVCCIVRERATELVPVFLEGLRRAGERRGFGCKLHVAQGDEAYLPEDWRTARTKVRRAEGDVDEPLVESLPTEELGREWEWEETPEVSLKIVEDAAEAVALFNRLSPRFAASLIATDQLAQRRFYESIDAAFVGDGMTRWVDGQFALNRPELGLSNWQHGRLFARGGVLSGDSVFTVRSRMRQVDQGLNRWPKPAVTEEEHVVRGSGQTRP
jgi:glutamate-5-semialdehyde dehydrogenase